MPNLVRSATSGGAARETVDYVAQQPIVIDAVELSVSDNLPFGAYLQILASARDGVGIVVASDPSVLESFPVSKVYSLGTGDILRGEFRYTGAGNVLTLKCHVRPG